MLHIFGTAIKKKKVIILGIIYILLLTLVILAGKAKKMKLQERASQTDSIPVTAEQVSATEDSTEKTKASSGSYSSFDTASVLQTLASATEAENNGLLTLVNMSHTLPADWTVDLVELRNDQSIDRRAYDGLQKMMDDARAEGLDPLICSSYRTNETLIWNRAIVKMMQLPLLLPGLPIRVQANTSLVLPLISVPSAIRNWIPLRKILPPSNG